MQKAKIGCPPDWVDAVWRLNSPTIYKLCEVKCKSSEDAKDLFQTVALKFCQNAKKLQDRPSALPWLITVVKTSFCDFVAEKHSTYSFSKLDVDENFILAGRASGISDVKDGEDFGMLEKFMEEMPPLERMIFEMSYIGGLSTDEISSVVGLSSNAIRKRKHHALVKLREKVEKSL